MPHCQGTFSQALANVELIFHFLHFQLYSLNTLVARSAARPALTCSCRAADPYKMEQGPSAVSGALLVAQACADLGSCCTSSCMMTNYDE